MDAWIAPLLAALALPKYGLTTVFVVAFVSATLLPMGSEPAVFGLVKLNPDLFWPAVLVATAGNTLGGALTWWMGYGAERVYERVTKNPPRGASARIALARAVRRAGVPAVVAAGRRRPAVRRRRLAAPALLAVRDLHGDRQVRALRDDDGAAALGVSGERLRCERERSWVCSRLHDVGSTPVSWGRGRGGGLRVRHAPAAPAPAPRRKPIPTVEHAPAVSGARRWRRAEREGARRAHASS